MRIVLQKVSEGFVDVVDETSGEVDTTFEPQHIGIGYVLLVGVEDTDGAKQIDWLARKIANLRVFEAENGKMNRSIKDIGGEILSILQFTLFAGVRERQCAVHLPIHAIRGRAQRQPPKLRESRSARARRTDMARIQRRPARTRTRSKRRTIRLPHARAARQRRSCHHHP